MTEPREGIEQVSSKFGITPEDYMLPARTEIHMLDINGKLHPSGEQGVEPGHEYPLPSPKVLVDAYEQLVIGRRVNDQNSALVRQGRMAVYPSSHGQEAAQVAAALCLGENDWMFPTYRDTVAVMAKGLPPWRSWPDSVAIGTAAMTRKIQGLDPIDAVDHPAAARGGRCPRCEAARRRHGSAGHVRRRSHE